jgi:hypothetical protein
MGEVRGTILDFADPRRFVSDRSKRATRMNLVILENLNASVEMVIRDRNAGVHGDHRAVSKYGGVRGIQEVPDSPIPEVPSSRRSAIDNDGALR